MPKASLWESVKTFPYLWMSLLYITKFTKHTAMSWRRLNGDLITEPLIQAVEKTIIREQEAGYRLKLCIGTDSQTRGDHVDFATVIVFLREGRGGFMFIHHSSST